MSLLLLGSIARAEVDTRAEMKIQASPLECTAVWSRLTGTDARGAALFSAETEAQADAYGRIEKACAFADIAAKVASIQKAKRPPVDGDFPGPRVVRVLPRDALAQLVEWLVPTAARPIALAQDAVFRKLRYEAREVLAGRDPYGGGAK